MTEDEAKAKWCPHVRLHGRDSRVIDFEVAQPWVACIGSACMAWRWSEAKRSAAFLEAVQAHMQGMAKPNFNTALQAVYAERGGQFERVEGYCGLAGAA